MGDLNYRLDVSLGPPEMAALATPAERWAAVNALIAAEDWAALNALDELKVQIDKGNALSGFCEGPKNFPPTFKVAREGGYNYNPKRVPSYCDRILWRSFPGMEDMVEQTLLEPLPDIATSDHKVG